MKNFSVIFYAINGAGLGHISRALNIARELKSIADALGINADIKFVTTSEGSQIASEFPVYKLPSMNIQIKFSTDTEKLLADNQFFVANLFGTFRPDIAVLDTKADGAYEEFRFFEKYCRKRVFINRRTKPSVIDRVGRVDLINSYDLVLIPDSEENSEFYPKIETDKTFTGVIHGYRPESVHSREKARQLLGVDKDERLIYLSSGGGGDANVEREINAVIDALSERKDIKLLVGYGPLYRGDVRYDSNLIPYTGGEIRKYFGGLDGAISAAGYNTYQELLAARVPTLFFYQKKGMDDQCERVLEGESKGWNFSLSDVYNRDLLLNGLQKIMDQGDTVRMALSHRPLALGSVFAAMGMLSQLVGKETNARDYSEMCFVVCCLIYWKCGLHNKYEGEFTDYVFWALKTQPLVIGESRWQKILDDCERRISTRDFSGSVPETFNRIFRDSERIVALQEKPDVSDKESFNSSVLEFLKAHIVEPLSFEILAEKSG